MPQALSEGALLTICQGGTPDKPILQVLGLKKVAGGSTDRYRIFVSDGKYSNSFSMLATQMNEKMENGQLDNFSILRVNNYTCNNLQQKKVIILLDIDVLEKGTSVGQKIGEPIQLNADGTVEGGDANNQNAHVSAKPAPAVAAKRAATDDMNSMSPSAKRSPLASNENKPRSSILEPRSESGSFDPSSTAVFPINGLTPYQNRWTIKARVTHKSDIRKWSNTRGTGHLFNFDLIDESGEIRATAFKDQCDKYYNLIEVGKVYYITACTLKAANRQFSNLNNEYEMTLRDNTEVVLCKDETNKIPTLTFNFVKISELANADKDAMVDIIAICKTASESTEFTTKAGKQLVKRDVTLVDDSNSEVNLTLWGGTAETFDPSNNPVIAVKGVKVSDFNGVSVSALSSTVLQLNPDLPQSHALKGWYESDGANLETVSLTVAGKRPEGAVGGNVKCLAEVKLENIGSSGKYEYYSTTAYITMIRKENVLYKGCPNETDGKTCNKKLTDNEDGTFMCHKCTKSYDTYNWRMILSFSLADMGDYEWVNCFQEQGEQLLGMTTTELGQLQTNDPEKFNKIIGAATFKKYNFRMSCKEDTYNGETKIKHTVRSLAPVDEVANIKNMIKVLEEHGVELPPPDRFDKSKYL